MQLKLRDLVETPDGKGTIVNLVRRSDMVLTAYLVHLDGTENVDRDWRAFSPEEVKKWPTSV